KGLLQQVAPPQELYERPVNLFVGGFIGSPAMNMVEATLNRSDGRYSVQFGTNRLTVDDAVIGERPGLAAFEGKPVVLGIRPEDFEDAALSPGAPEDRRIGAGID